MPEKPSILALSLIGLVAALLGTTASLALVGTVSPGAAQAGLTNVLASILGALAALLLWIALERQFRDGKESQGPKSRLKGAIPLLGLYPLAVNGLPALRAKQGDPWLLAVAAGAAAICVLGLWRLARRPLSDRVQDSPMIPYVLGLLLAAYALAFTIHTCLVYHRHGFWGRDEATSIQSLWSSTKGYFFYNSLEGRPWVSHFALHNSTIWVFWWLAFRIVPRVEALIALNTAAIALSSIPVYLLARSRCSRLASLGIALAFLSHPYVGGVADLTIQELQWTCLPLTVALLGVQRRKPALVIAGSLGLLMVQEYLGIVVFIVGLLCLWRKMPRTGLAMVLLGPLWLLFSLQIVFPYFGSRGITGEAFDVRFGYLGKTPAEVIRNFLRDPLAITWSHLVANRSWIYYGVAPVLFVLPLLSVYGWAALLPMYAIVIQGAAMSPMKFAAGPAFAYAALVSLFGPLGDRLQKHFGMRGAPGERASRCALALALLMICSNLSLYRGWAYYRGPQMSPAERRLADKAIAMIPSDASVTAPDMLAPQLAQRRDLALFRNNRPTEWIISDEAGLRPGYPPQRVSREFLARFGPYRKVWSEGGIEIWRRR